jgi:hypothetical protein
MRVVVSPLQLRRDMKLPLTLAARTSSLAVGGDVEVDVTVTETFVDDDNPPLSVAVAVMVCEPADNTFASDPP